jgi:hypothetical protein
MFATLMGRIGLAESAITTDAMRTQHPRPIPGDPAAGALPHYSRACFTLLLLLVMACQRVQPGRVRPGYGALCGVRG